MNHDPSFTLCKYTVIFNRCSRIEKAKIEFTRQGHENETSVSLKFKFQIANFKFPKSKHLFYK